MYDQQISASKAAHPFDDPAADIILRTSDGIDFYTHSPILSYASPVFSSMLSLPQPDKEHRAEKPVIDVSEDSQTIDRILRLCYPIVKPHLSELEEIVPVLKAALKYEMEWPVLLLSKDLLSTVPSNPLKVWAVACRVGLEDVARAAAIEIRRRVPPPKGECPGSPPPLPVCPLNVLAELLEEDVSLSNLLDISAGDYFRLREFLRPPETPDTHFLLLSPAPSSSADANIQGGAPVPLCTVQVPSHDGFIPRIPLPDVLLQGRDQEKVIHRAHGVILALQSPTLGERFSNAKADHTIGSHPGCADSEVSLPCSTGLPLLKLDVPSDALASLLAICYDGPSSLPSFLPILATMLVASHDLGMVQIRNVVATQWDAVAAGNPLEAYCVAVRHGLKDQARAAARKVVEKPLAGSYVPCLEDVSALAYHNLLVYYEACVLAVKTQLDNCVEGWNKATKTVSRHNRFCNNSIDGQTWMISYLRGLQVRAGKEGPGRDWEVTPSQILEKIGHESGSPFWPSQQSAQCQSLATGIVHIGSSLPTDITNALAQVRYSFSFSEKPDIVSEPHPGRFAG